MPNKKSLENLKKGKATQFKSGEDAATKGKRGGIASGIAKKQKKTMAEALDMLMEKKLPGWSIKNSNSTKEGRNFKQELIEMGIEEDSLDYGTAMACAMVKEAMKGNTYAYSVIRDTTGSGYQETREREKEEKEEEALLELENSKKIHIPAIHIAKSFIDINRDIDNGDVDDVWAEGGRASTKSSFYSEKGVEILENNPDMCGICIRRVGNTLKDSIYEQMQWGIDKLGEEYPEVSQHWKSTKSPLVMINQKTGQRIYYRGADDPGKIKSIKPPKGKYIGLIIYEEFDQMQGMTEIRKIDQSLKRGGDKIITFRLYNTPKSSKHFVNIEKKIPKKGRVVHRSTYLDVPKKWLGEPFIADAEYMKKVNPQIYANEYLGEETGDGGAVFENLEIRDITDEEIETFDNIYMGLDFGWFPDPLAWTKMCYDSSKKILYIFDEFVVNKMSNEDVWEYLQSEKNVQNDDLITADSAEKKSIGDFKAYGSTMRAAEKGPGSVNYSMKWLCRLAKIVIDRNRCPVTAKEFEEYEYEKDKDDNYISSYPDKNNHCIDSVRYAMNSIWKKKGE